MNNEKYSHHSPAAAASANASSSKRLVQHQFLTKLPDLNTIETDLMKLLNDFTNNRLKKYGTNDLHEVLFKKMDAVRDKQEKIAKNHFEQDARLTESKVEGEDFKAQAMRDLEELTRQLEDLNNSIHDLQNFQN